MTSCCGHDCTGPRSAGEATAAGELDARLAAARYTARSADQLVTAVATDQGVLLDLRIDDRALASAHTHKLGLSIVEAVRAARAAANTAALPQLNALFGKTAAAFTAKPAPAAG